MDWNSTKHTTTPRNNNFIDKKPSPTSQLSSNIDKKELSSKMDKKELSSRRIEYDSVTESFEEYLTIVNILGNICVKSVKSRN